MELARVKRRAIAVLITAAAGLTRAVQIANTALPVGVLQAPYSTMSLTAINGTPPYTWSANGLPPGISLSASGAFSGTPTATGSYFVGLQVVDNGGANHVVGLFLDVNPPPAPALWASRGLFGGSIRALAASPNFNLDGTLLAQSPAEIFRSTDGGNNWTRHLVDSAAPGGYIFDLALSPVFQYSVSPQSEALKTVVATSGGRVYKSVNHGASYTAVLNDPQLNCEQFAFSPNYAADATLWTLCFSGVSGSYQLLRSQDRGLIWNPIYTFAAGPAMVDFAVSPNFTSDQTMFLVDGGNHVQKSVTGGTAWTQTATLPISARKIAVSPRYATDQALLIGGDTIGLQLSTNGGGAFNPVSLPTTGGSIHDFTLVDRGALPPTLTLQGDVSGGHYSVFTSIDYGLTFTPLYADGLRRNSCCFGDVHAFAKGGKIFSGSEQGVDASTDGGFSFAASDKNIHARDYAELSGNGQVIGAGINGTAGWYKSGDTGLSWVKMPQPDPSTTPNKPAIPPNYAADHVLFLTGGGGLYRSTEGGASFTGVIGAGEVYDVAFAPSFNAASGTMFAATSLGLYKSTNGGQSFALLTGTASCPFHVVNTYARLRVSPGFGTDQAVFINLPGSSRICKSVNGGTSWAVLYNGFAGDFSLSTVYNDGGANGTIAKLFFILDGASALQRSLNGGVSFTAPAGLSGIGLLFAPVASPQLALDATVLLPTNAGVYRSSDNGASFAPLGAADQLKPREATGLYLAPTFNGNLSSGSEAVSTTRNGGLWRSTDGGRSFAPVDEFSFVSPQVNSIVRVPGGAGAVPTLLAATGNQGVFRSDDGGLSFANISKGLPADANARAVVAPAAAPASPVTAVPGRGLWRLSGTTWANVGGATLGNYAAFGEDGTWIYAMRQDGVSLRSNTGGASWVTQDVLQPNLVAVHYNNQAGPTTLIPSPPGRNTPAGTLTPDGVSAITAPLWSVSLTGGPRYSVDSGVNWVTATGGGDYALPGGLSWSGVSALGINPASGSREVLAGSTTGLYRTTDGGLSWRSASATGSGLETTSKNFSTFLTSLTPSGSTDILAGILGATTGGVYLSGDGGEHWTQVNQGFDPNSLNITTLVRTSCAGCPVQYYTGTYGSGVYTRTLAVNPQPSFPSASAACFGATSCTCGTTGWSGPESGGQAFKLCGANFLALAAVEFDGLAATGCVTVNPTTITCTATPPHVPGNAAVRVRNTDTRAGYLPAAYSYTGGSSRASNLHVAKAGNDANLTWICASCGSPPAKVFRSQNAPFTLNVEQYTGGAGSYTNTGALAPTANPSYFWSVE